MNSIVTNKGNALLAKGLTGIPIEFSKIALGDGNLGAIDPKELNDIISKRVESAVSSINLEVEGIASVSAAFSNEALEVGFYYRECGLFAIDPDEGEILYSYGNAAEYAEYIAPTGSSTLIEKVIKLVLTMGDAVNAIVELSSDVVATREYVNQEFNMITPEFILDKIKTVDGSGSGLDADTVKGYVPLNAESYTAADILAKLLTVDGPGSGLNADFLDGLSILDIGRINNISGFGSTSDPNAPVAPFILSNHANAPIGGQFFYIMTVGYGDIYAEGNVMQLAIPYNSTHNIFYRVRVTSVWSAWLSVARTDSPAFTGNPTAPTPAIADNDTSLATTAYVRSQELKGQVTVTNTGWAASSIPGYVFKQAPIAGVAAADYPSGGFNGASFPIAKAAGIDYVECYAGGIVLAGTSVPTSSVTFDYVIRKA